MFDKETANLLQSAPALNGLDPQYIPALLTRHYTYLASARLRGADQDANEVEAEWSLERIADTYELIVTLLSDSQLKKSAAFVAGTAQQILSRRPVSKASISHPESLIRRDAVDPKVSAALLFLAAGQYADANEAAASIPSHGDRENLEIEILVECIADLARGKMVRILERVERWGSPRLGHNLEDNAFIVLLGALIYGLRNLAASFLMSENTSSTDTYQNARGIFVKVRELSTGRTISEGISIGYAGPYHMASLLISVLDGMQSSALIKLPPPVGADNKFWSKWLEFRATIFPYIWPNHQQALNRDFHQTNKSAVLVLPTGAGKTTVSSIKIAGTLARGKKVIFLAPTHALVDQLTTDLQEVFPQDLLGSKVSSDFDMLLIEDTQLREIEVMTPERCLAMLSFAADAFSEVGLLVFDECHLLSPQSGKIRRALDGMLCILAFQHIAPSSDLLFLSAMLNDAEDFSQWITELTGRACVCVDLLWKPSRQARGVVIYKSDDLDKIKKRAISAQAAQDKKSNKPAKALRTKAKQELKVEPWAIWGLQHNWLEAGSAICTFQKLSDTPILLDGSLMKFDGIRITPNANQVAASLAISAAHAGLKCITFVNTKNTAISVANNISEQFSEEITATEEEQNRWDALELELGGLQYSILSKGAMAVPHNSSMLKLERNLAEMMFKRPDGARVIVATPTLAQGLNLPAHIAILAGDKRADPDNNVREDLEAHEILNAAARAGRAGHLANGIVLLVPEPIIQFSEGKPLDEEVVRKLKSVLPEDDRCVTISDPLEVVLDRIMLSGAGDADVDYIINRMAALREIEGVEKPELLFDLKKSLGAFSASKRAAQKEFEAKIDALKQVIAADTSAEIDATIATLASQSGLRIDILLKLKKSILDIRGQLPLTIEGWLSWTIDWLAQNDDAREALLRDIQGSVSGACGMPKDHVATADELLTILPGLIAWTNGDPLVVIERLLGGTPDEGSRTKQMCPRARELVGSVIPRGLSFIMGFISRVVEDIKPFEVQGDLDPQVIECLATAIRLGYSDPNMISFASTFSSSMSRVQIHLMWRQQKTSA